MKGLVVLFLLLTACGPGVPEEDARVAVKAAFEKVNPPGRVGYELVGKTVWLRADVFEDMCLEQNDLAFNDDEKHRPTKSKDIKRISPTYKNQRFITANSEKGRCVYMGTNPTLDIQEATWDKDHWVVSVKYGMETPSPWFECLKRETVYRQVDVGVAPDKTAVVNSDMALFVGECPAPLPTGEERRAQTRPTTAPSKAPTKEQVTALMKSFDQAMYDQELVKALEMVSCYNLFEDQKYGTCAVSELISLGPLPRGQARPNDGIPWLENVIYTIDAIGKISRDSKDPTLYHVDLPVKKGNARSLAIQWVQGQWKLVGVVGEKAPDITSMRFVYDLDRKDKRDIFERRMNGEPIDDKGFPLDPYAEVRE